MSFLPVDSSCSRPAESCIQWDRPSWHAVGVNPPGGALDDAPAPGHLSDGRGVAEDSSLGPASLNNTYLARSLVNDGDEGDAGARAADI